MTYVKICPKCGSINIGTGSRSYSGPRDFCKDCGFPDNEATNFSNFPEIEINKVKEFQKEIKGTSS